MSDIGLAGGVTSTSPGFSDLASAQSDSTFTGTDQPIYYTGTNIRRTPVSTVAPTPQFNLFDFLKSATSKKVGKTIGDMIVPGRNTPLGIFSVLTRNPTVSVVNALAGAMMNMNRRQQTSGLLGGLKDISKSRADIEKDAMYDDFGNLVTVPTATVTGQTLAPMVNRDLKPLGLASLVDRSLEQTQQQDIGGFYE
jgi:hypothetical protein